MSYDEKCELIKNSISYAKGKIPIVCGTGTNDTATSVKLSQIANMESTDGVLVVSPYYNKGNEEGIYLHYKKIADEIYPTPVILYNVPSRTGIDLSVNLILRLAKTENIVAIKEASPSLEKAIKLMNAIKSQKLDFSLICGNDSLTIPFLSIGGIGTISVFANLMPNIMHEICLGERDLFFKYYDLIEALSLDVNPIMIKTAMNYMGMNVGNLRLPLYHAVEANNNKLYKIIDRIK